MPPQSKFLVEFLQEKQEPFSLKDYLVERGYRNPSRISKISAILGLKKRSPHAVPHCSDVFKHVFSQLLEVKSSKRIKNTGTGEPKRLSSATSTTTTTMSISCSESDPEEDTNCQFTKEGDAKGMSKRRQVEDNKQLSPVSVLEQTEPDYDSPVHYKQQCNYIQTQGTLDSQRELGKPDRVQELQQLQISDSYSQYIINRKILRQSRKLLIDCTREVIEYHKKKDKRREHLNQILGTDQLWKLVCENVWQWSQDLIDETNTSILVSSDVYAASEEWSNGSNQQKMEIAVEIGDAILDDIIHEIALN